MKDMEREERIQKFEKMVNTKKTRQLVDRIEDMVSDYCDSRIAHSISLDLVAEKTCILRELARRAKNDPDDVNPYDIEFYATEYLPTISEFAG